MISLKQHMEMQREEALASAIECCRGVVSVIAASGARACPTLASDFQSSLMRLRERLLSSVEPAVLTETGKLIQREVDGWGSRASDYYRKKAAEIREIMLAMTEAAKAVAQRDRQYQERFDQVSARLLSVANLEDIAQIRELVGQTASELSSCAARMVEEGEQSITGLRNQLSAYEQRLAEAERISETDALTGLANRAGFERALHARIHAGRNFSVLLADLNGFKEINDRFGHLAGDELLKSFAAEFRSQFRNLDFVARWGGDEFVVILDASPAHIESRVKAVREWAAGEYTVHCDGKPRRIQVTASVGVGFWKPGMSAEEVFNQADRAMYEDKMKSGASLRAG
jgi:diguanylate cyclase (GGDEF)-like protein